MKIKSGEYFRKALILFITLCAILHIPVFFVFRVFRDRVSQ